MKTQQKRMFRILTLLVVLSSCAESNKAIHFKHNSDQTGIFESDPIGNEHTALDDTIIYTLKAQPSISLAEFEKLEIGGECYTNELCVDFQLTEKGTLEYEKLTRRNLHNQIFFVINGVVITAPEAAGVITSGMGQFPIPKTLFDSLFVEQ